jgi:hypothetical protein
MAVLWKDMATELKGEVRVGRMDVSENKGFIEQYKLDKFPAMKVFPPKAKDAPEDFEHTGIPVGGAMADTARDLLKYYNIKIKIPHVTGPEMISSKCSKKKALCVVAVVDSTDQLEVIKTTAKKFYSKRL